MTEFGDDVYAAGVEDAEDLDPAENLTGDGTPESLDEPEETRWDPPDYEPAAVRRGMTLAEQQAGESLDQRLSEEEPDVGAEGSRIADPALARELAEGLTQVAKEAAVEGCFRDHP